MSIDLEETDCPLCGSASKYHVVKCEDHLYGVEGRYDVNRCTNCRHVYLSPRPTRETIGECYPDSYVPFRTTGSTLPEQPSRFIRVFKAVPGVRRLYHWLSDDQSTVEPPCRFPHARAIEIGCGSGEFLARLCQAGWDAVGIEPSEQAARRATERGLDVRVGTLDVLRFPDDSFDAAFAWMVLEHVHDPLATLRQIAELLKPGGDLYLSVPNYACWEPAVFGRFWMGYDVPRHLHQFTPRSLESILSECGYEEIRFVYQGNVRYVIGSLAAWLCARNVHSRLGTTLMDYFATNPPMLVHLLLAPLGKLLAFFRQSSRLTVHAKRSAARGSPISCRESLATRSQ